MLSSQAPQVNQLDSFFDQMVHEAALYPPGSESMDRGIADRIFPENAAKVRIVGPFLRPVDRFSEMQNQFPSDEECDSALLGSDPSRLANTYFTAVKHKRLRVTRIELALLDEDSDNFGAISYIGRHLLGVIVFAEVPRQADLGPILDRLALEAYGAKMRTWGLASEMFPSEEEVARFLVESLRRSLPVKVNAGLHSAVHHRDDMTGFEHQSFLNFEVVECQIVQGEELSQCIGTLRQRDSFKIVEMLTDLAPKARAATRALFVGYGSCSIDQPYQELLKLGLLEAFDGQ